MNNKWPKIDDFSLLENSLSGYEKLDKKKLSKMYDNSIKREFKYQSTINCRRASNKQLYKCKKCNRLMPLQTNSLLKTLGIMPTLGFWRS